MPKVTVKAIKGRLERVNSMLKHIGSKSHLVFERRYDYYALDTYDNKGDVQRTLKANLTKRQAYDLLLFTEEILNIIPEKD